jgi:hypothetical protein
MAKSGNTWFKKHMLQGKKNGFAHHRTMVHASPSMDMKELVKNGFVRQREVTPRKECNPVGFVFDNRGAAKAARRAAYHARLGL